MAVSPAWNDRAASVAETVGGTTRRAPDSLGGVGARTMKGHGRKSTPEEQDKKIIRQEQSDKQEGGGREGKRERKRRAE